MKNISSFYPLSTFSRHWQDARNFFFFWGDVGEIFRPLENQPLPLSIKKGFHEYLLLSQRSRADISTIVFPAICLSITLKQTLNTTWTNIENIRSMRQIQPHEIPNGRGLLLTVKSTEQNYKLHCSIVCTLIGYNPWDCRPIIQHVDYNRPVHERKHLRRKLYGV